MAKTKASQPATLLAQLAQPSSGYKRRVWLAVAGLVLFLGLYFLLAGWFLFTAYRLTLGADSLALTGYLVGICALFLAIFMLKPVFFVKHGGSEGAIEITRQQQPRLYAFLYELADSAKAPRPHKVLLSPRVNASVFYDLSTINLFFPSKKNLEIGLALMNALTLGEFRAVLAHEFGHFTQRSMAVTRWAYIAQQIAAHLVARRDKLDQLLQTLSRLDLRIAWVPWLVSLIVWSIRSLVASAFSVLLLLERALSREMEMQADLVAVSLTGSDALIHALHRLRAADDSWDRTVGFVRDQLARNCIPRDVFTLHARVMERMGDILCDPGYGRVAPVPSERAAEHRVFQPDLAQPPQMWLTHPLNHEREANAKRYYVSAPIDERSAWTLFDTPAALREQVSAVALESNGKETVSIEESVETLNRHFDREYFRSRYRGAYVGRSVVLGAARPDTLVEQPPQGWRHRLDHLYAESLTDDVARLRNLENEVHQLRALQSGALKPPEGVIRHRGRVLKPAELPQAIELVEREARAVEERLQSGDRQCRSVHLAAANELGGGWAPYLRGLLAALHYADHTEANLRDLHGLLAHTVRVVTVTRRVRRSGMQRLLDAANALHEALGSAFRFSRVVTLDASLLQRLGIGSWEEFLGRYGLQPADSDNIGEWLKVIDGWVDKAAGACMALRTAALEQLLLTEAAVAEHIRLGTSAGSAPSPSVVLATYDVLLPGAERKREVGLSWWERFQIAHGVVPSVARVAVAAGIVAAVLGFGSTVGTATITIHNGLALPVVGTVGGQGVPVSAVASHTLQVDGLAPRDVAEALADMADRWYPTLKARVDGPAIVIGEHQFAITSIVEHSGKGEAAWAAGVRFEVAVDGHPAPSLTLGAVGTDTTREGALRMAVVSYVGNFGIGLLESFAKPAAGYSVGEYRAYPGFSLDRGGKSSEWLAASSAEAHVRMLAALEPTVTSYARDSITGLSFFVEVDATGSVSGECWLGGRRIDSALPALYALPWPKTGTSHFHKVTYVLVRQG